MHKNEIAIDISLVKKLLLEQFPHWAGLPIKPILSSGTDNAIYKLGDDMCIRLPRIPYAAKHLEVEQAWLPLLAPRLPLTISMQIARGKPNANYPLYWAIYTWINGENAYTTQLVNQQQAADDIAQFLIALQSIDATGGPQARRGQPLTTQNDAVHKAIASLHGIIDTHIATNMWHECLQTPAWDKPPLWLHGDLLPANIIIQNDKINAIIDFDSLGIGDPACDLLPAWSLFSSDARDVFRSTLEVDDATWMRGRGWALSIALIIIPYYKDTNPALVAVAHRILGQLLTA